MKKQVWIAGIGCVAIGALLMGIGFATHAFDTQRYLESLNLEEKTIALEEEFSSVSFDITYEADLTIRSSAADAYSIQAKNLPADALTVSVQEDTLQVHLNKKLPWYYHISFFNLSVPRAELVLTLPEETYEKISVQNSLGDVKVEQVAANALSLHLQCGDLRVSDLEGESLSLENNLGNIHAQHLTVSKSLSVEDRCGDITLKNIQAEQATQCSVQNNMGENTLSGGTYRNLTVFNNCGDIQLQGTKLLEDCSITCDLGDLSGTLAGAETDYSVDADCDMGDLSIGGAHSGWRQDSASCKLLLRNHCGDIDLEFLS